MLDFTSPLVLRRILFSWSRVGRPVFLFICVVRPLTCFVRSLLFLGPSGPFFWPLRIERCWISHPPCPKAEFLLLVPCWSPRLPLCLCCSSCFNRPYSVFVFGLWSFVLGPSLFVLGPSCFALRSAFFVPRFCMQRSSHFIFVHRLLSSLLRSSTFVLRSSARALRPWSVVIVLPHRSLFGLSCFLSFFWSNSSHFILRSAIQLLFATVFLGGKIIFSHCPSTSARK